MMEKSSSKKSVFEIHQALFQEKSSTKDAQADSLSEESLVLERQRVQGLSLKPLQLPKRGLSELMSGILQWCFLPRTRVLAYLPVMAAAAFFLFYFDKPTIWQDEFRIKGSAKVKIYWERTGQVQVWERNAVLQNGDRISVEVLSATKGSQAALFIFNEAGQLMSGEPNLTSDVVDLPPLIATRFPGSIKLVGPSEGERALVFICDRQKMNALLNYVINKKIVMLREVNQHNSCDFQDFKLR